MVFEPTAVLAVVLPFVKDYLKGKAEKLLDSGVESAWAKLTDKGLAVKANEAFVERFGKELDSAVDLATLTSSAYQAALESFLHNPSVQDAILAPLDGESELDWKRLQATWAELHLIELPDDFRWRIVAKN